MTASRIVEEEHGTYTRTPHPHNGYYAGDFRGITAAEPTLARLPRLGTTTTIR